MKEQYKRAPRTYLIAKCQQKYIRQMVPNTDEIY